MTQDQPKLDLTVELSVDDHKWDSIALNEVANRSASEALKSAKAGVGAYEISILACNDARIVELNGTFRDKLQPTNVLSWPDTDLSRPGEWPLAPEPPCFLGDIAIAFETTSKEAAAAGLSLESHVSHLLLHGTLHLLGFDHVSDTDAALMEELEVKALARMGIDNPYSSSSV